MGNSQVRLLEGQLSDGLETCTSLVRCSEFSAELGKRIRQPGGAERAVRAMLREFFPGPDEQLKRAEQPNSDNASVFSALIVYAQPDFKELKSRFSSYVEPDLRDRRFYPIKRCRDVSMKSREVAFEYVCMDRNASLDEAIAEMNHRGLRPALYEELLGFAEKYPDEQRKYQIVACGSFVDVSHWTHVYDQPCHIYCAAALSGGDYGRSIEVCHFGGRDKNPNRRFLAVREAA